MATNELKKTSDYSIFTLSSENRSVENVSKLTASMTRYGFLRCHPLHVVLRDGKLVVLDGQHRLKAAKALGIPVYYVIEKDANISIPEINCAQRAWSVKDFVHSFASQGLPDYIKLKEFAESNGLPMFGAASLLIGSNFDSGNTGSKIRNGEYRVRDERYANSVAAVVRASAEYAPWARNGLYVSAISMCLRVREFSARQYIEKLGKHSLLLVLCPNRDAFLDVIESIYNRNSPKKIPLAFLARQMSRQRAVAKKK